MNTIGVIMFDGVLLSTVAGVCYGFYWASKNGQWVRLQEAARGIFDRDEPVGAITDAFPDEKGLPKNGVTLVRSLERYSL